MLQKVEKEIVSFPKEVLKDVEAVIGNVPKIIARVSEEIVDEFNDGREDVEEIAKKIKEKKKPKADGPQLIFDLYDISNVEVEDPGLKNIINLDYKLVIKSKGRNRERFSKEKVNIVERLINYVGVPGHRGKKHKVMTSWASGKYNKNAKQVLTAFKIIEERTKQNPIQTFVKAIENASPRDEVTIIQYGGARYPQAVDTSPLRRVSLALRNIVHGAYDKSFGKKKHFSQTLAEEIILASNGSGDSVALNKRNDLEKQADGAR